MEEKDLTQEEVNEKMPPKEEAPGIREFSQDELVTGDDCIFQVTRVFGNNQYRITVIE